jgi:hypothetical protein
MSARFAGDLGFSLLRLLQTTTLPVRVELKAAVSAKDSRQQRPRCSGQAELPDGRARPHEGGTPMSTYDSDREALARAVALLNKYVDGPEAGALALMAELPEGPGAGDAHPADGDSEAAPTESTAVQPRGPRQEAILALPEMATAAGLKPAVVAARIDYSVSNTYTLLQTLGRVGLVEQVPGSRPQRWRLTKEHRNGAELFCRIAAQVYAGEWTTCADISLAARGDTSAAWMVCWAAERLPDFPNPHRVLLEGGRPHPYEHEHQRGLPGVVSARLVAEGVRFDDYGRAERASRVGWDDLRQRIAP